MAAQAGVRCSLENPAASVQSNLPFCERQPVNHPVSLYAANQHAPLP
jgi:hypothetical protein